MVVADKTITSVPLVALLPVQLPPLAVQLLALLELQVNVIGASVTAVLTLDVRLTVGGVYTTDTPYSPNCCCVDGVAINVNW
jgi:hypothetical protein